MWRCFSRFIALSVDHPSPNLSSLRLQLPGAVNHASFMIGLKGRNKSHCSVIMRNREKEFGMEANSYSKKRFTKFPFEISDGDRLYVSCERVCLTLLWNRTAWSKLFQMYLFLQAAIQNTCGQLVFFSMVLFLLGYLKRINDAVSLYCTQSHSSDFCKLFTKWHIGNSCFKEHTRHHSAHLDVYTPTKKLK